MSLATRSQVKRSNYLIIDALNVDWMLIQNSSSDSIERWAQNHSALSHCVSLDDVLSAVRMNPDPALTALLSEDAVGDQLAGRVVLQAMLGKVVRMARRDCRSSVDQYVSAMWCRIRTYPLTDRPVKIASNLALDTLKAVTQETQWSRRGGEVSLISPGPHLDQLHDDALIRAGSDYGATAGALTADGVISTAGRLGLIDGPTRDVLLSVYADGLSGRDAADRHQTTASMVRFRCSRGVRKLALHSASLSEAA